MWLRLSTMFVAVTAVQRGAEMDIQEHKFVASSMLATDYADDDNYMDMEGARNMARRSKTPGPYWLQNKPDNYEKTVMPRRSKTPTAYSSVQISGDINKRAKLPDLKDVDGYENKDKNVLRRKNRNRRQCTVVTDQDMANVTARDDNGEVGKDGAVSQTVAKNRQSLVEEVSAAAGDAVAKPLPSAGCEAHGDRPASLISNDGKTAVTQEHVDEVYQAPRYSRVPVPVNELVLNCRATTDKRDSKLRVSSTSENSASSGRYIQVEVVKKTSSEPPPFQRPAPPRNPPPSTSAGYVNIKPQLPDKPNKLVSKPSAPVKPRRAERQNSADNDSGGNKNPVLPGRSRALSPGPETKPRLPLRSRAVSPSKDGRPKFLRKRASLPPPDPQESSQSKPETSAKLTSREQAMSPAPEVNRLPARSKATSPNAEMALKSSNRTRAPSPDSVTKFKLPASRPVIPLSSDEEAMVQGRANALSPTPFTKPASRKASSPSYMRSRSCDDLLDGSSKDNTANIVEDEDSGVSNVRNIRSKTPEAKTKRSKTPDIFLSKDKDRCKTPDEFYVGDKDNKAKLDVNKTGDDFTYKEVHRDPFASATTPKLNISSMVSDISGEKPGVPIRGPPVPAERCKTPDGYTSNQAITNKSLAPESSDTSTSNNNPTPTNYPKTKIRAKARSRTPDPYVTRPQPQSDVRNARTRSRTPDTVGSRSRQRNRTDYTEILLALCNPERAKSPHSKPIRSKSPIPKRAVVTGTGTTSTSASSQGAASTSTTDNDVTVVEKSIPPRRVALLSRNKKGNGLMQVTHKYSDRPWFNIKILSY